MNNELRRLFIDELREMYDAEQLQIKLIAGMSETAAHPELSEAFEQHLEQTMMQIERIEQSFEILREVTKRRTSPAMRGLIEEGNQLTSEYRVSTALDASLISTAQKTEHYEIASYRRLSEWSKQMNLFQVTQLLEDNLQEEKDSDALLSDIAAHISDLDAEAV